MKFGRVECNNTKKGTTGLKNRYIFPSGREKLPKKSENSEEYKHMLSSKVQAFVFSYVDDVKPCQISFSNSKTKNQKYEGANPLSTRVSY